MKQLVLLSFSLTLLAQGFADGSSAAVPNEQVSVEEQPQVFMQSEDSPEWCLSPYHEFHASVRHNEANGIGYKEGYTTLEVFGIFDGYGSGFMPFFDVRGHVFNDGKLAGNLGIGERTLLTSIDHTFGSYLYYDVRRVGHGLTVNQLSPGIELVGERMEYRINGYFPLGKQKGSKYGFEFDEFKGHSIILKAKQQQAMMGGDAEVGVHIPQNTTYDIYAAAGPYYFHSSNASAWGGKARLLGRYKEYVTLEVAYSYDHLFRNVVQGSIAFTVPFGGKLQRCGKCCPQDDNLLLSRAAFAPSRFEIPVVKRVHRKQKAINPATGEPWVVWFVNNTSSSAGTFESPFPTLLAAQNASSPNEMIYVFAGNGTTTGMSSGITLKNGQNFFGSGTSQQFSTTKGTATIPMFSSNRPSIAGGVVVNNSNIVSGFNVTSGGIGNTVAPTLHNLTVINNNIVGGVTSTQLPMLQETAGILFIGTGNVNISNNTVNGVTGTVAGGIGLFVTAGGTITGQVANNSLGAVIGQVGIRLDYASTTNEGSYNFIVANNTIPAGYTDHGIIASVLGTNSTVAVINNTIVSNATGVEDAIIFTNLSNGEFRHLFGNGHMTIANNTVNYMVPTGAFGAIGVSDFAGGTGQFQDRIDVENNTVNITQPGLAGVFVVNSNATGTYCVTMNNNRVTTSTPVVGFYFNTTSPGVINVASLENNIGIVNTTGTGVNFVAPGTCGK